MPERTPTEKPQAKPVKKVTTPAEKQLLAKVKRLNLKLGRVKNLAEQLEKVAEKGEGMTPAQVKALSKKLMTAITS
jgi:hypothetical protein